MQAGAWAAIGFPVCDKTARDLYYKYANLMYQVGVFFSRSSGAIFQVWLCCLLVCREWNVAERRLCRSCQ